MNLALLNPVHHGRPAKMGRLGDDGSIDWPTIAAIGLGVLLLSSAFGTASEISAGAPQRRKKKIAAYRRKIKALESQT